MSLRKVRKAVREEDEEGDVPWRLLTRPASFL